MSAVGFTGGRECSSLITRNMRRLFAPASLRRMIQRTRTVMRKRRAGLKERLDVLLANPPGDLALENLEGFAYRFTVYLPRLSFGKEVFTRDQLFLLEALFNRRFQGYSATLA